MGTKSVVRKPKGLYRVLVSNVSILSPVQITTFGEEAFRAIIRQVMATRSQESRLVFGTRSARAMELQNREVLSYFLFDSPR